MLQQLAEKVNQLLANFQQHRHTGTDANKIHYSDVLGIPTYEQTLSVSTTTGFIVIPTCAGTPTGTPIGGKGSIIYDTTDNKIYVWNGAWKSVALT